MNKMKNIKYGIFALIVSFALASCSNEVEEPRQEGNPTMQIENQFANMHFGDILPFEVTVNDNVPLSTLTAKLYFGEEEVSKTTIRTKENGQYSGTIKIPYGKNIPDGTATLEFILVNTTLKKTTQTFDVPVSRASYPYLILVSEGASYPMISTGEPNEYMVTAAFPSTELPAYIKTPVVDNKGGEIIFGWGESGTIEEGTSTFIPFASAVSGTYSVTFNTKTLEASPFFEVVLNGQKMNMIDKDNYQIDIDLTQGAEITLEGLTDWWIDPDFFAKEGNKMTFVPISGKYRVTANLTLNYLKVEALAGSNLATLQPDGTGAIWIIGENIGKPSVTTNMVGWNTDKALCMAPIGNKKYRVTVVAGSTVSIPDINFKFFHQKGWGGEFSNTTLTTTSNIVFVGAGESPGPGNANRDPGNLGLYKDKPLTEGKTYVFTVDVSAGIDKAVLTVEEK